MSRQLKILKGGLLTSIQDMGRFGYRKYGVPVSGTMDSHSAELANWLVGNPEDFPVIECTIQGPSIEFKEDAIVGMSGANGSIKLNELTQKINSSFEVKRGDILNIGQLKSGCRLYVAIKGEWDLEKVMQSYSTCLQAEFGGYEGGKLKSGDVISWKLKTLDYEPKEIPRELIPHFSTRQEIRIIPGPEWNRLNENQQFKFLNTNFRILGNSNRMGILLKSSAGLKITTSDMRSAPVVPGIIQLPPDGNPIILMKDAQSVGGYPRIAKVAEADIWRLGQIWKGNEISFGLIDQEEAIHLLEYLKDLKEEHLPSNY